MNNLRVIPYAGESPEQYNDMPEGLDGYWWQTEHIICIPFVASNNEGDGTFSKWLNELESKGKTIFFPTIISARLGVILKNRGYIEALDEFSPREKKLYQQDYVEGLAKIQRLIYREVNK